MKAISIRETNQDVGLKFSKETSKSIIEFLNTLNVEQIKSLPNLISINASIAKLDHRSQDKEISTLRNNINLLRRNVSYNLNRLTIDFIDSYVESCSPNLPDITLTSVEKNVFQKTYVFGLFSNVMNEIFDIEAITRTYKLAICNIVTTLKTHLLTSFNSSSIVIDNLEKVIFTNYGTNTDEAYTSLPVIPLYEYIDENKHELYTVLKDESLRSFIFEIYFPELLSFVLFKKNEIFSYVDRMMVNFFNHHKTGSVYGPANPFVYFNQFFLEYDVSDNVRNDLITLLKRNINSDTVNIPEDSILSKVLYLYIPEMIIMCFYTLYYFSSNSPERYLSINNVAAYPYEMLLVSTFSSSPDPDSSTGPSYMNKRVVELFSKHIKDDKKPMNYRYDIFKKYITMFNTSAEGGTRQQIIEEVIQNIFPSHSNKYDDLYVDVL
jgi:hypothetical protein